MEKTSSKTSDSSIDQNENKLAFEPKKGKVIEHTKLGVWDLYQERDRFLSYLPTSLKFDAYAEMWNDLPYLWRAIHDLSSVAWPTLLLYLVLTLAQSLLPAMTLWCVRLLPRRRRNSYSVSFQVFWTTPCNREHRNQLYIPSSLMIYFSSVLDVPSSCRSDPLSA